MFDAILWGGVLGGWSATFCLALTEPGEVFSFVGKAFFWVKRFQFAKTPGWAALEKVAYLCPKCHAGQLALWTFPALFQWTARDHFACLAIAVFIGFISEKFVTWLER